VKLLDQRETIMIVVGASLGPDAPDRHAAEALRQEIDRRGLGSLYRRAVLVTDDAWFESELLHQAPTIAVGGPGVNSVSEEFAGQLLTVWTSEERVVVQIDQGPAGRRALLWGVDAAATAEAVAAFVERGWLSEFLTNRWVVVDQSFA